jgi:hypothetical protein
MRHAIKTLQICSWNLCHKILPLRQITSSAFEYWCAGRSVKLQLGCQKRSQSYDFLSYKYSDRSVVGKSVFKVRKIMYFINTLCYRLSCNFLQRVYVGLAPGFCFMTQTLALTSYYICTYWNNILRKGWWRRVLQESIQIESFLKISREQGCQMGCFQTKNPYLGKFWRVSLKSWYIVWPFDLL